MPVKPESYYAVLTLAIDDLMEHGYDSAERVAFWSERLSRAARETMAPEATMEATLRDALADIYRRLIERGAIVRKYHFGISRFTLDRVKPQLRLELDRRILAAANLIKINKRQAMETTLRRFQGWATSIPIGGTEVGKRSEVKRSIREPLANLSFIERRVIIDQGHKFTASLNNILATSGGAIALTWRSNWRQPSYDYREEHKERDGQVYTIRPNWALSQGLMKVGPAGYYDKITAVGEEVYCRCYAIYIYALRDLPREMLTKKGIEALDEARARAA